jgi:50S ribosomal protein L16 3-hydroxylase
VTEVVASSDVPLGDLSPDTFFEEYWQTQPLVVRNALPDFESPLDPGELAGLACEEGIESRLILKEGGAHPWELREGPFDEDDFLSLPETQWTVLVQEVDRLIPEVGALRDRFSFLPDWRIDDVMVSYAPTGGTVGPHIDNYDVFLVQGLGRRRWSIGRTPVEDEAIVPDRDVRILAHFEPDETFVLGPGDLLYLPPRVAHHGISADDQCMTYSVGFRAPSHRDLIGDFLQHALEQTPSDARYSDPDRTPADHPGDIDASTRADIRAFLRSFVADDADLDRWFGQFITRPQRDRIAVPRSEPVDPEALAAAIRNGRDLRHGPATRLAFIEHDDGSATLFANGDVYDLSADAAPVARRLSGRQHVPAEDLAPLLGHDDVSNLLADLVNDGLLELVPHR